MSLNEKDAEILRLKIQLLEAQLAAKDAQLAHTSETDKDRIIAELRSKLDEPDPVVARNVSSRGTVTREMLSAMSPGELFILARKKGIKIETMFPL